MNFRPTNIRVDKGFISNVRHFTEQSNLSNVIVTSGIRAEDSPKLNCVSYLNNSDGGQQINWCPFFDTLEAYLSPLFCYIRCASLFQHPRMSIHFWRGAGAKKSRQKFAAIGDSADSRYISGKPTPSESVLYCSIPAILPSSP